MRLWLALCCCISAFPLRAEQLPPLDPADILNSQWTIQDDPHAAAVEADRQLQAIDRTREPVRWAETLALFANAVGDDWDKDYGQRHVAHYPEAIRILESAGSHRALLILQFTVLDNHGEAAAIEENYRRLIERARAWNEAELEAQFLFKMAHDIADAAPEKALNALQDALKREQQTAGFHPVYAALLKSHSALALDRMNQVDRALGLLEDVDGFLQKHPLRYFSGIMHYNYGAILMSRPGEGVYEKALEAYRQSSAAAASINDVSTAATSLLGVAQIKNSQKKFAEALDPTEKAAAMFIRISDAVWAGEAYKRRSAALIGLERFREALAALDQAEKLLPEDSIGDQRDLAHNRALAYAGAGDFAKAYEQQLQFSAIDSDLNQRKISDNYARQLADLGLEVETQRNARLQEDLRHASRQKMLISILLGLAGIVLAVAAFALWKAREVRRSRNKMERILSNIDEGILTFSGDLRIESEYSRHLEEIFGLKQNLTGMNVLELLLPPTAMSLEQTSLVQSTLQACIGEEPVAWDLNEGQLPAELHFGSRILIANWTPIIDQQKIRRILLCLRDVTARRQLERDYEKARQRHESMQVKVSELIDADLHQTAELLRATETLLQGLTPGRQTVPVLRALHTQKGAARTLGLRSMSGALHELESACQTADEASILAAGTAALQHLAEYQHLVFKLFQTTGTHAPRQRCLADVLRPLIPDLARRAQEQGLPYEGFVIHDAVAPWPEPLLGVLQPILLHACNNSLDHGFLFPRERGEEIDAVRLEVEARVIGYKLWVWIRDNGNGLNVSRLRAWAGARGLTAQSDSELAELLFEDGQSTAEATTATSGRGVGLAAVRSLAEGARGTATLHNRADRSGTELQLSFPWEEKPVSRAG